MTENAFGVKATQTKVIKGHTYTTTLYPGGDAFDHLTTINDMMAGPAGGAISLVQAVIGELRDKGTGAVKGSEVTVAMSTLSEAIVRHGGAEKIKELLAHTTVKVSGVTKHCANDFDEVWQGRAATVLPLVLAWVLEVNFAPFGRGALGGVKERLIEMVQGLLQDSDPSSSAATSPTSTEPYSASPNDGGSTL